MRAKREGTFELQLSERTGPVRLERALHGPNIAYSLVSVAGLYDDRYTV